MISLLNFLLSALIQFISYSNLVVNFRAIAHNQIVYAMLTDAAAAGISYFIIRRVATADSWWTLFGMMVGGSLAAWVGMTLTKSWG